MKVLSVTEIGNCGKQTQAKINNELVVLININVVPAFMLLVQTSRRNDILEELLWYKKLKIV